MLKKHSLPLTCFSYKILPPPLTNNVFILYYIFHLSSGVLIIMCTLLTRVWYLFFAFNDSRCLTRCRISKKHVALFRYSFISYTFSLIWFEWDVGNDKTQRRQFTVFNRPYFWWGTHVYVIRVRNVNYLYSAIYNKLWDNIKNFG